MNSFAVVTDENEEKEGKKGSPPIPLACFSWVYFAPAPVIFFALPFYGRDVVPAFQVQIDVFQSVLTSTCEKKEGMQKKNSSPCKIAKQKRGSVAL